LSSGTATETAPAASRLPVYGVRICCRAVWRCASVIDVDARRGDMAQGQQKLTALRIYLPEGGQFIPKMLAYAPRS